MFDLEEKSFGQVELRGVPGKLDSSFYFQLGMLVPESSKGVFVGSTKERSHPGSYG